jgi:hypothetical protein
VPTDMVLDSLKHRNEREYFETVISMKDVQLRALLQALFEHDVYSITHCMEEEQVNRLIPELVKDGLPSKSQDMILEWVKENFEPTDLVDIDDIISAMDEDEFLALMDEKVSHSDVLHHIANNL